MTTSLIKKFEKAISGEWFLLDPNDFEYGTSPIIGIYHSIKEVENLADSNFRYYDSEKEELKGYKLKIIGNALELFLPENDGKQKIPRVKSISQEEFLNKIFSAEYIYIGKEEIINAFKTNWEPMKDYAESVWNFFMESKKTLI